MGKECFTCAHKLSTDLTKEQRKDMRDEEISKGVKWPRIPEMIFHCLITKKRISQIDPACDKYKGDDFMEEVRTEISKSAKKLREELENNSHE